VQNKTEKNHCISNTKDCCCAVVLLCCCVAYWNNHLMNACFPSQPFVKFKFVSKLMLWQSSWKVLWFCDLNNINVTNVKEMMWYKWINVKCLCDQRFDQFVVRILWKSKVPWMEQVSIMHQRFTKGFYIELAAFSDSIYDRGKHHNFSQVFTLQNIQ